MAVSNDSHFFLRIKTYYLKISLDTAERSVSFLKHLILKKMLQQYI
jgi:hypothetical protein